MSCENLSLTISSLIEGALDLSGRAASGANNGNFVVKSVGILNNILAEWSTSQIYIPYTSTYTFPADMNKTYYSVGPGYDIDTSPFTVITGVWYEQSGTTIPLEYQTFRAFNRGTYKKGDGYPSIYTYELRPDYTLLGILPNAHSDLPITIYGKQALLDVTLFTSQMQIPAYMRMPLEYSLANELIARGVGTPQGNFSSNYTYHMSMLKAAPQIDTEGDIKPTLLNAGSVVPLGNYWGGVSGGGRGSF